VTDGLIVDKLHDLAQPGEAHTVDMATARLAIWMHGLKDSHKFSLSKALDCIMKLKKAGRRPHHYKAPKDKWWTYKGHDYNDNTVMLACISATNEMQGNGKRIFYEDASYAFSLHFFQHISRGRRFCPVVFQGL
jgi:hypothetical protein